MSRSHTARTIGLSLGALAIVLASCRSAPRRPANVCLGTEYLVVRNDSRETVDVFRGVGSDYNLLLISRFKEEIDAGIKTGMIRTMAGTGSVVTSAGLVFAATMSSFVFSDLRVLGQIGTTIGLGLLFDTLIVRAFMTPSIAVLLGRWFWWPRRVRPRPASQMLRPYGPRPVVRALLGRPGKTDSP